MIRYRFSEFTLSPQRRLLVRDGQEVPLIPRYFDLLLLLVERRREAVHRREIFDRVWADAIVSDSALSQAIRTIRSTLGDDSREPRFIRTVSRHGYQFVFPDVVEEEEDAGAAAPLAAATPADTTPRWVAAAAGSAAAGLVTGIVGGLILVVAPGSTAPVAIVPVLALVGATCGAIGGAGVGAGFALAARRGGVGASVIGGALGGGVVGTAVQWLSRWALTGLLGIDLNVGGGLEGIVIGGAAGLGFAMATRRTALITALCCGLAGLALTLSGRPLAAGTIHLLADAAEGSRATLAPLARLVGEQDFGGVSGAIFGFLEGAMFGVGLAYGLLWNRRRLGERP